MRLGPSMLRALLLILWRKMSRSLGPVSVVVVFVFQTWALVSLFEPIRLSVINRIVMPGWLYPLLRLDLS